jgi:predicted transcriptional regulator
MFDNQVKREIIEILSEFKTINEELLKGVLFTKFPHNKKPHINKNFYNYITELEEKGYIKTEKEELGKLRLSITNKGILLATGEIVENGW